MTPNNTPIPGKGGARTWAGFTAVTILLLAGCVVTPDEPSKETPEEETELPGSTNTPERETGDVLASSMSTSTEIGSKLQIEVQALERIGSDFLRLRLGITNESPAPFNLGFGLGETNSPNSASEISLIDEVNGKRYFSYAQSDGKCFCNSLDGPIASGESEGLWVMFPQPPGDLNRMTVATPLTPPMFDIPISDSSESIENSNLADAQITDLILISDNTDDQTGRTESGEEVSIILSSDVLFDTNSSDLSNDSETILEQVSQEIDDASSSDVSIDGYADNTGNDDINIPLSKDRANSVESALSDLISREGVTFTVEGHGSADPIASNETEDGRERNRRVTVTFEK